MQIYHVTTAREWAEAERAGVYERSTRDRALADVGFIHCSYDHQLAATIDLIYGDCDEPLVALTNDPADLPCKVEDGFPHVYSSLPRSAVVQIATLDHPKT